MNAPTSSAATTRRLPAPRRRHELPEPERVFLIWLALFGLMLAAALLMWRMGVWHMLLAADPTYLTLVIVLVFSGATLWCGHRTRELAEQRRSLRRIERLLADNPRALPSVLAQQGVDWRARWIDSFFLSLLAKGPGHWRDHRALGEVLDHAAHASHDTAWWVNGIQLKLGLLGKVIGFSVLALQIGSMESFDAGQSQQLLKNLTSGLGIALLTTMTGLTGNILLGLQLTRIDRYAEDLVADAVKLVEVDLARVFDDADNPA